MIRNSKTVNFFYLGNSKMALAKIDYSDLEKPSLVFFKETPSKGYEISRLGELEGLSADCKALFEAAELDNFPEITLVLAHPTVRGYNFSSSVFYSASKVIGPEDVEEVIRQTRNVSMVPLKEKIIQSISQEYWVNDSRGIQNPLDLEAERLGASLRLLSIEAEDFRNIVKIFDRSEAEIVNLLPKAYASSFASLEESEKRSGVLLLNAGGRSLDTVYFKEGIFFDSASARWGGDILTQEISRNYRLKLDQARKLKEDFGTLLGGALDAENLPMDEEIQGKLVLTRGELRNFLESRLESLWACLDPIIGRIQKEVGPLTQLVLTGGASKMEGLLETIEKRYQISTRQGNPKPFGLQHQGAVPWDASYSALWGAAASELYARREPKRSRFGKNILTRVAFQTREWLESYF